MRPVMAGPRGRNSIAPSSEGGLSGVSALAAGGMSGAAKAVPQSVADRMAEDRRATARRILRFPRIDDESRTGPKTEPMGQTGGILSEISNAVADHAQFEQTS